MVGKFFMIKPNGNCFLGEQAHGDLFGFIYPFMKIEEAYRACMCGKKISDEVTAMKAANSLRAPSSELSYNVTFIKMIESGSLLFSYWDKGEVRRGAGEAELRAEFAAVGGAPGGGGAGEGRGSRGGGGGGGRRDEGAEAEGAK